MSRLGSYPLIIGMVGIAIGAFLGASVVAMALGGKRSEAGASPDCVCPAGSDALSANQSPAAEARSAETGSTSKASPINLDAPTRPSLTVLEAPLDFPGGSPALRVSELKTRLIGALRTLAAGASDVHGVECGQYPCVVFLEMDGSVLTTLEKGAFAAVGKVVGDGASVRFGDPVVRPELLPVDSEAGTLLRHLVAVPILEEGAVELSPSMVRVKLQPRIEDYFDTVPRAFDAGAEGSESD